ncbi:putative XPC-binding domain containing protein [Leishmania naiffi]|uniref:XPC-binding domain containing protein n=1 Tax=Leishmania naiffi TaxID=5678 RepID=A0AAW3B4B4_9TRYP
MSSLPSSAAASPVTLRSVSGKSLLLPPPVTLAAVLKVATAPPFSFAPESVKLSLHGRLVRLLQYQKQHGEDLLRLPLDASAYTPFRAATKCREPAVPASHSSSGTEFKVEPLSVIVYGVPQRIQAPGSAPYPGVQKPGTHSIPFLGAAEKSLTMTTFSQIEPLKSSPSTCTSVAATSTAATASRRASLTRSLAKTPMACVAVIKGPLPYPHSPDGLQELGKICAELDSDDDDDLITLLQGAPQSIYNHPTVLYMSNKVKGDLVVLQAMMEQIAQVSPAFFDWIAANPQKFLSALNRGGERSLQQVKDQLRMLAMRAMAEQMSGETPSRHVMMLEVNTRDGSPDVYQVEVQVGDFSDASTPSDSLITTSVMDNNSVEEEKGDEAESMHADEEVEDNNTAVSIIDASSEDSEVAVDTEEAEEENELHRGAILLPSTAGLLQTPLSSQPPPDAVPLANEAAGNVMLSHGSSVTVAEEKTSTEEGGAPFTLSPPADAAPVGIAHSSFPFLSPTPSAAVRSTSLDAAASPASSAVSPQDNDAEDARLLGLRQKLQQVNSSMEQWARQATSDAAQRTHTAIAELRGDFFTVLNDLITSSTTPASFSESCRDVRRLALFGCHFFSLAEEFYVQLDEQGVRSSFFGETPQDSVAAWAFVAALSRLLVCDVDAAVEQQLQQQQQGAPGPHREGALRSLLPTTSNEACPVVRWSTTEGPEKLLMALLHLCRQQRSVVLWYSSHYVLKEVGKTIQTMSYILGGTEEAQQTVSLQRLKVTSKAHKQDEVADCITTLSDALTQTGTLSDTMRWQWFALMRSRYQRFVLPLEKDLPAPHMTSNPLYVCDTRHVLPPKDGDALSDASHGTIDSAARWWAGYCDDRHTCCADKWCLAMTTRLWNVVTAMRNTAAMATAERVAVVLTGDGAESNAANSLSLEASVRDWLGHITWMPVDSVVAPSAPIASESSSSSVARHSAVLCEQVMSPAEAKDEAGVALNLSSVAGVHGMLPLFRGDVHMVDVAAVGAGQRPVLSLAGGVALPTYLATVVRNFVLPASARASIFSRHFFGLLAKHPRIPMAAAVRDAALANARAQDSPWLVSEYVLFDYGGALSTFADAYAQAHAAAPVQVAVAMEGVSSTTPAALPLPTTAPSADSVSSKFVRMPSVPLSQRLSMPRPLPPTQRRPVCATFRPHLARATGIDGELAKRQYARTHAVDELYEMMLGSLVEHQPSGEADVLDHLVQYVEASQDVMRGCVCKRQAEVAAAVSEKGTQGTTPDHAAVAGGSTHSKPQPPGGKRNYFARRRQ